jgi:hypothetical protein
MCEYEKKINNFCIFYSFDDVTWRVIIETKLYESLLITNKYPILNNSYKYLFVS